MSCLDVTTCATDQIFSRINCNFTIRFIEHICNPINTCRRADELYDCCSSNISECIIERVNSQLLPTISPTLSPTLVNLCGITCNRAPSTNKCYFYESQNLDISCVDKEKYYCCQTLILHVYITFGSIFLLITGCLYYKYFIYKYTRIVPDKTISNIMV
jgi:hypothetical protein